MSALELEHVENTPLFLPTCGTMMRKTKYTMRISFWVEASRREAMRRRSTRLAKHTSRLTRVSQNLVVLGGSTLRTWYIFPLPALPDSCSAPLPAFKRTNQPSL